MNNSHIWTPVVGSVRERKADFNKRFLFCGVRVSQPCMKQYSPNSAGLEENK